MLDPVDVDPLRRVIDSIEKAIISDPQAITVISGQLETSDRPGFLREGSQLLEDTFKNHRFKSIHILLCRRKEEEFIHGAFSGNRPGRQPGVRAPAGS